MDEWMILTMPRWGFTTLIILAALNVLLSVWKLYLQYMLSAKLDQKIPDLVDPAVQAAREKAAHDTYYDRRPQ